MQITVRTLVTLAQRRQIPCSFELAWCSRTKVNPVTLAFECVAALDRHRLGWLCWMPLTLFAMATALLLARVLSVVEMSSYPVLQVLMNVMTVGSVVLVLVSFRKSMSDIGTPLPDMSQVMLFCDALEKFFEWSGLDPALLANLERVQLQQVVDRIMATEARSLHSNAESSADWSPGNLLTRGLSDRIQILACLGFEVFSLECYRKMYEKQPGTAVPGVRGTGETR